MVSTTSMPTNLVSSLITAIPLIALGCATEEVTSTITQQIVDPACAECAKNGPLVEGSGIGHLGRDHQVNDWGVTLVEFWHKDHPALDLRVKVELDQLSAVDNADSTYVLHGKDLIGGVFVIQTVQGVFYEVRILDVSYRWNYWTNPPIDIEGYTLSYDGPYVGAYPHPTTPLYPLIPLCPEIDEPWLGEHTMGAAVFEGEIYHQADLSFQNTAPGPDGWFTVACAGSATLKQLLTRRTPLARPFPTGIVDDAQRRSMLRAWTADYCGSGDSFTITGVPLLVRDGLGTIPTDHRSSWSDTEAEANEIIYEAVRDERGAVCFNEWRRDQDVPGKPEVHDESAVTKALLRCEEVGHPLPPCRLLLPTFPTGWQGLGKVLTALPSEYLKQ